MLFASLAAQRRKVRPISLQLAILLVFSLHFENYIWFCIWTSSGMRSILLKWWRLLADPPYNMEWMHKIKNMSHYLFPWVKWGQCTSSVERFCAQARQEMGFVVHSSLRLPEQVFVRCCRLCKSRKSQDLIHMVSNPARKGQCLSPSRLQFNIRMMWAHKMDPQQPSFCSSWTGNQG